MNIVEKKPNATKTFVSEAHNRMIKWMEGGRIVHYALNDNSVVGIENYTKGALAKIINFLEVTTGTKIERTASFNAASRELLNGVEGFKIEEIDGSFFGIVTPKKSATNKIRRSWNKNQEIINIYLPTDQNWKMNMRYKMIIENDGSVQFEEFEEILPENLNQEYAEPLLNVYQCHIKAKK